MPNIQFPRRRSPLQDLYQLPSQTTGPDIQPMQIDIPQMVVPEMQPINTDGLANLSAMGTKRAMGLVKKKPAASGTGDKDLSFDALKSLIFS